MSNAYFGDKIADIKCNIVLNNKYRFRKYKSP